MSTYDSIMCPYTGRDPRAMDARVPVTAQRVPIAPGMQGPVPHTMGPNAPPPARPVRLHLCMSVCVLVELGLARIGMVRSQRVSSV